MEYDKLDLRFPWRFFQGKNIITADSILYCTRNLERNITKDYSKEKASWQKDKEKILGLQIKWKKKFSISKNQACQHKHFIAHRKELSFNKPLLGRGLKKKKNHCSVLAGPHYWYPGKPQSKLSQFFLMGRGTHILQHLLWGPVRGSPKILHHRSQSTINYPFKIILGKGMLKVTTLSILWLIVR